MEWFKVRHDLPQDPKFDEDWIDERHRWLWMTLLFEASKGSERGVISYHCNREQTIQKLARAGGIKLLTQDEIRATLEYFQRVKMVRWSRKSAANACISLQNWCVHQSRSPSDEREALRERQRRSREKRKLSRAQSRDKLVTVTTKKERKKERKKEKTNTSSDLGSEGTTTTNAHCPKCHSQRLSFVGQQRDFGKCEDCGYRWPLKGVKQ